MTETLQTYDAFAWQQAPELHVILHNPVSRLNQKTRETKRDSTREWETYRKVPVIPKGARKKVRQKFAPFGI